MPHLVNQHRHHNLTQDNTLHVVGVCSNPARYHSRHRLTREWAEAMEDTPNVATYVVEAAYGDRHHEVTSSNNPRHLQLRTKSEVWVKENMINLGVRHLVPRDAKYIAWVDADIFFRDPQWAQETLHQLQHTPVLQPWSQCADLGHQGQILQTHQSFGFLQTSGIKKQRNCREPYAYGHSGFAWACTRAFWEQTVGLMDFCILGSADHHMAWAMIDDVDSTIHKGMSPSWFRRCHEWQQRALRVTNKDVGFVHGRIEHSFHGAKKHRYYRERWQILVDAGFDPDKDLMYDEQGMIQLVGKPELEIAIRKYNRSRQEDEIAA